MLNHAIFSPEEIEALKNDSTPIVEALFSELLDEARIAKKSGGSPILLSFGYYVTGDAAYFAQAQKQLTDVLAASARASHNHSDSAENEDDLLSECCFSAACTVSLFGDLMEQGVLDTCLSGILTYYLRPLMKDWILPDSRVHGFDNADSERYLKICAACGASAALLYDLLPNPEAGMLLSASQNAAAVWLNSVRECFRPSSVPVFSAGRNSFQGISSFDRVLCSYLQFALVYRRRFGKAPADDSAFLADYIGFLSAALQADQTCIAFGETDGSPSLTAPLYLLRAGFSCEELLPYFRRSRDFESEKLLWLLDYHDIFRTDPIPPPQKKHAALYPGIGWAILRPASDHAMLAITAGTSGFCSDAGHFVLFRQNQYEIFETPPHLSPLSRKHAQQTERYPEYKAYCHTAQAHNVLLFDGCGQETLPPSHTTPALSARFVDFCDAQDFQYAAIDATGPMSRYFSKHIRHFICLDTFVLIYDEVSCRTRGCVSYLLHASEQNCHRMLTFSFVSAQNGYFCDGSSNTIKDSCYLSFDRDTDENGQVRFAALLLTDEMLPYTFDENRPDWTLFCGDYRVIFRPEKTSAAADVIPLDAYRTDADILILKNGLPFAVIGGSVVRSSDGEQVYLHRTARFTGKIAE